VQKFVYVVPNLTPDDALKPAQRRLAELNARLAAAEHELSGAQATLTAAEGRFGGPRRGPVVVRQVEVGDPEIEGAQHHRARVAEAIDAAEVVPQSQ